MSARPRIYLDYNATTPTDERVVEAMLPYFTSEFGNASSGHEFGLAAREAVERAREQVATLIGAEPNEIIFTGGATESNNLAIKGMTRARRTRSSSIVTCVTEHRAVLDPCARLEREGVSVTRIGVDRDGQLDMGELGNAITEETALVSIMHGNNETGVLHPLNEIGEACAERGVIFHTDATQTVGKLPVDVRASQAHLLSLSAHKMYGPKGVGALYVRRRNPRVKLMAELDGGGHERGLRSGTLNVPGIVGLGAAAELRQSEMAAEAVRLGALRDRLRDGLTGELDALVLNGGGDLLPNTLNIAFGFVDAQALLNAMEEVAVSTGSACSSAEPEPSHVLRAMGRDDESIQGSVRFSLGRETTSEEIELVIEKVVRLVRHLRSMSPLYEMHKSGQ